MGSYSIEDNVKVGILEELTINLNGVFEKQKKLMEVLLIMITNVYFVRHAQPDFSIKDDLIRPLTEEGIADSKKVTTTLINREIAAVYSSPYKRAIDTIKDFADTVNIEIMTNDNFCERRVGEWLDDFRGYSEKQWEDFDFKLRRIIGRSTEKKYFHII